MSSDRSGVDDGRQLAAQRFGKNLDPLAQHDGTFRELEEEEDFNPFDLVRSKVYDPADLSKRTRESYETAIRQWTEFVSSSGRHPACPSDSYVRTFVDHLRTKEDRPNSRETVKEKLTVLNRIFEFWQFDSAMPHDEDFNPFKPVLKEGRFKSGEKKDPHQIQLQELGEIVRGIKHIRDRGVVTTQLKLGSRATATCNIKLLHLTLGNEEVRDHYSELGSHARLDGRENAIYIPHDVEGNKSKRPWVFPLDEEMRRVLIQWLLIRPDNRKPYLFLSDSTNSQMERGAINVIWQKWFPKEYLEETELYKPVTSHYGRHWFSTYWEHQGLSREQLKYLRGDKTSKDSVDDNDAVNDYIHTYYEDIEEVYRERIFKLGV